tara:strand:- start:26994 stop:27449 length:456 start_codon:yes stop_codon:yes gene_type:complete
MILDKIENSALYTGAHPKFHLVFDFIKNKDLLALPLGKHLLEDRSIFAIVMEYDTLDEKECKVESHKKYIDLQYMVSGAELTGVTSFEGQVPSTAYNEENDFQFYNLTNLPKLTLKERCFAVYYPDDIHQTTISIDGKSKKNRKVVFKILM